VKFNPPGYNHVTKSQTQGPRTV